MKTTSAQSDITSLKKLQCLILSWSGMYSINISIYEYSEKDNNLNGCHCFASTVVNIQCKGVNLRHKKKCNRFDLLSYREIDVITSFQCAVYKLHIVIVKRNRVTRQKIF